MMFVYPAWIASRVPKEFWEEISEDPMQWSDLVIPYLLIVFLVGFIQMLRNRPQGLTIMATVAKLIFLFSPGLISGIFMTAGWVTFMSSAVLAAILYLALTDIVPALRVRAGLDPLNLKSIILRVAVFILPPAVILIFGLVTLAGYTDPEINRVRTKPFSQLAAEAKVTSTNLVWDEERMVYLRPGMTPASPASITDSIYFKDEKGFINHNPDARFDNDDMRESVRVIGYESIYEYQKAIWNAGLFQPVKVVLKNIFKPNGTLVGVYHLETDQVNAILWITHFEDESRWWVNMDAYKPGGGGFGMFISSNVSREAALAPAIMTLERHIREGL
jgi:hypothetical protein